MGAAAVLAGDGERFLDQDRQAGPAILVDEDTGLHWLTYQHYAPKRFGVAVYIWHYGRKSLLEVMLYQLEYMQP